MRIRELGSRLRAVFDRRRCDDGAQAEMRFHVEMEVEAAMRRGMNRLEAQRAARLKLGSVAAALEAVRDQRGFPFLDGIAIDMRQAWTALRRRPGYLLVASGALIAAVAVNTLVFTILYGVVLRPLPYPEPGRLARLFEKSESQPKFPLSIYNYRENKRSSQTLDGQALYTRADMQLMHGEHAEMLTAVAITEGFFPLLGAPPIRGRNFVEAEMLGSARVVILSHALWTNRFNADPEIVGKPVRLDRENWIVVGIAPAGFEHVGGSFRSPLQGDTVAIWRPLPLDINEGCSRGCHYTNAIVRLKPGVTLAAAEQDLNRIMEDLARQFPDSYGDKSARLEPLYEEVTGASRRTVFVIAAAGGLVLLLACVNIAGLSVARSLARRREIAVRLAIGGSRIQILRAVLSENAVLAAISAVLGIGVAAGLMPLLRAWLPSDFPRVHEIVFRWPSAVFAVAAAAGTSLLAGLVAALRHASAGPAEALHDESRTASGSLRTGRLRAGLVAAQMALAYVLCAAAVLLLRSSIALNERDPGFHLAGVLTFELSFPSKVYENPRRIEFYAEARRRIKEIPGVQSAGFATAVPWSGYDENTSFDIPGYTPRQGESVSARYQAASPGFVEALGMRLVKGRTISEADAADQPKVLLVNEALSRRYFPNVDPIGRVLDVWGAKREIAGVVADIRDWPADLEAHPAFWMPLAQTPFGYVRGAVRADGKPSALVAPVRAALSSIDRELPMAQIRTMSDIADAALAERHFTLRWCQTFAGLAIALAVIGIYALLTYSVQQRYREIGIRMVLGATRANIAQTVFTSGLTIAVVGTGAGIVMSPAVGRALSSLLYGVSSTDVVTLLIAAGAIIVLTAVACLAPAWSAVRAEPVSALREQ